MGRDDRIDGEISGVDINGNVAVSCLCPHTDSGNHELAGFVKKNSASRRVCGCDGLDGGVNITSARTSDPSRR